MPDDDTKFATLREYRVTGAAGSEAMAGEAFAVLLLQNPASTRRQTVAAQWIGRAFAADSLQKQQTAPEQEKFGQ